MYRTSSSLRRRGEARPAWWQWPGVLSLEVPLIAVAWQRLLGDTLAAPTGWPESLLLALVVWLIYSADRLLDGWGKGEARTRRHHFYIVQRRSVLGVWLVVSLASLGLALTRLGPMEFIGGTLLAAAMVGYFVGRHRGDPKRHPKELLIALLFALGVSLIPLANGAPLLPLLLLTSLFAALIFLNCALVARWERDHDLEPAPFEYRYPHLVRHLRPLSFALAWSSALTALLLPTTLPFDLALTGSSLLLCGLDGACVAARLGPEARRTLGDAALLTPLLVLLAARG